MVANLLLVHCDVSVLIHPCHPCHETASRKRTKEKEYLSTKSREKQGGKQVENTVAQSENQSQTTPVKARRSDNGTSSPILQTSGDLDPAAGRAGSSTVATRISEVRA